MVIAVLSMGMTVNAENESINTADIFTVKANVPSLARYLELREQQVADVADVQEMFTKDLAKAQAAQGKKRASIVKRALRRNCANMHVLLDYDQYKKYLRVLNATVNNRGLNL